MNEKDRNTSTKPRLVTAEAVRAGHPDKFCDQFADMLLDEHLKGDPGTRAAIEVMATDAKILVAGEVTSKASVDVEPILKQLCAKVGYTMEELSTGGELALDLAGMRLEKAGRLVPLTPMEAKILAILMRSPGRVFTKAQLYEGAAGDYFEGDENAMMVHISKLRDKIEDDPRSPRYIRTIRGLGYRFEA